MWQGERESVRARVAPERDASVRVELRTEGTKRKFVAILGAPPLTDAVTAVRAYAMSATRTNKTNCSQRGFAFEGPAAHEGPTGALKPVN